MSDIEKSVIKKLEDIQKNIPNIIIPSMGMIENDINVKINNEDYINKKNDE